MSAILDTHTQLVKDACNIGDGLTEWETKFVDSMATWVLDEKKTMTPKQHATLSKILDKEHMESDERPDTPEFEDDH